jgi:hypothetical protein
MTISSHWVQFKGFSGYIAKGGPKIDQPIDASNHISRAVYLTGQLEAGSWGTVQNYDGCGMSGGILHNISVMRDNSQGDFFALLQKVSQAAPQPFAPVAAAIATAGWTISPDGKVHITAGGALATGAQMKLELSGSEHGNVPATGPDSSRAQAWAERLATLLSNPATYKAQFDFAANWLIAGNSGDETSVYRKYATVPFTAEAAIPVSTLPPSIDLAMCVYHSFSVNAPGTAKGVLGALLPQMPTLSADAFAGHLIRNLGTKQFANWADVPGDGSDRYDRTRLAVWARPDLWATALAHTLMPRDL